jgi:hypothetical protein
MVEMSSSSSASAPGPDGLGLRVATTKWRRQHRPTGEIAYEINRTGWRGVAINIASGLSEFGEV